MAEHSSIEWTGSTWNPVTGCTRISAGCLNCYAERMAKRLCAMGQANYRNGFEVTTHAHMLDLPLKWKRPRIVFVNSMGDLFHEKVPARFVGRVFGVMNDAEHHTFQVLTKRAERLRDLCDDLPWADNIWMGVTVENREQTGRIDHLRRTGAALKFLSIEPLIGPLGELDLEGIDWVIVGGESGPRSRPVDPDWVREIRDQCVSASVPFFFKQWGGTRKKAAGNVLDGRVWQEYPLPF